MQFYIKNEAGDFIEADNDDKIDFIQDRLKRQDKNIRAELTEKFNNDLKSKTADLTTQLDTLKGSVDSKDTELKTLQTKLTRKDIVSEYGFSAKAESLLTGSDETEMRSQADLLKDQLKSSGSLPSTTKSTDTPPAVQSGVVTINNSDS